MVRPGWTCSNSTMCATTSNRGSPWTVSTVSNVRRPSRPWWRSNSLSSTVLMTLEPLPSTRQAYCRRAIAWCVRHAMTAPRTGSAPVDVDAVPKSSQSLYTILVSHWPLSTIRQGIGKHRSKVVRRAVVVGRDVLFNIVGFFVFFFNACVCSCFTFLFQPLRVSAAFGSLMGMPFHGLVAHPF
jgi:hypothetical protein